MSRLNSLQNNLVVINNTKFRANAYTYVCINENHVIAIVSSRADSVLLGLNIQYQFYTWLVEGIQIFKSVALPWLGG